MEKQLFPTRNEESSEGGLEIEIVSDESRIPGIDVSTAAVVGYVDTIFDAVKETSTLSFLNDFDTPIRREPLEILGLLGNMGVGTGAHLKL